MYARRIFGKLGDEVELEKGITIIISENIYFDINNGFTYIAFLKREFSDEIENFIIKGESNEDIIRQKCKWMNMIKKYNKFTTEYKKTIEENKKNKYYNKKIIEDDEEIEDENTSLSGSITKLASKITLSLSNSFSDIFE